MSFELYSYQKDAIRKLNNGSILCGGVGSGKSITALAYYFFLNGGELEPKFKRMNMNSKDLYIITTAKKRDSLEWDNDMAHFHLSTNASRNAYSNKVIIDSWNNIKKYCNVINAFFIFDEQRVVGTGAWVKAFLKIVKNNEWILLSATPGDSWSDYIPVFIANGFYKSKSEFSREHIVYKPTRANYPIIDRYINTGRLIRLRNKILVDMDYNRSATTHHEDVIVEYNRYDYKDLNKNRWNSDKNEPIQNASEFCYELRKVVNSDPSRIERVKDIVADKGRVIIFYNFDYELEILKSEEYLYEDNAVEIAEWNGHKHQPIPDAKYWVYLVQYTAGCEGWNCIKTDTIIFYSQNYSYKTMIQASGRIDRLNSPYRDLYYYHLKSKSGIDIAISNALKNKKKFNELRFVNS